MDRKQNRYLMGQSAVANTALVELPAKLSSSQEQTQHWALVVQQYINLPKTERGQSSYVTTTMIISRRINVNSKNSIPKLTFTHDHSMPQTKQKLRKSAVRQ